MLLIDGEPFKWGLLNTQESGKEQGAANAIRKFSAPHTWTVSPHLIKYDYSNRRHQVADYSVLTKYVSRFAYNGQPRGTHTVEYRTHQQPRSQNSPILENMPQSLWIRGGYESDIKDTEINFFHTYAPWTENGIAYDNNYEPKIMLFVPSRVSGKAETEMEIAMKVLTKIMTAGESEIIAMCRMLTDKGVLDAATTVNDTMLEGEPEDRNNHLAMLKNGVYSYAQRNMFKLRSFLSDKQINSYNLYELGITEGVLRLNKEGVQPPMIGEWQMKQQGKDNAVVWTALCTVKDDERPVDAFIKFANDKKSVNLVATLQEEINNTKLVPA